MGTLSPDQGALPLVPTGGTAHYRLALHELAPTLPDQILLMKLLVQLARYTVLNNLVVLEVCAVQVLLFTVV